jgi:hypothetical protein
MYNPTGHFNSSKRNESITEKSMVFYIAVKYKANIFVIISCHYSAIIDYLLPDYLYLCTWGLIGTMPCTLSLLRRSQGKHCYNLSLFSEIEYAHCTQKTLSRAHVIVQNGPFTSCSNSSLVERGWGSNPGQEMSVSGCFIEK